MNQTYKEKLDLLVSTSNLNENKKKLWSLFCKVSTPEEDEAIYEAASESDENLNLLSDHLKSRMIDLKDREPIIWKQLTDGEKRFVEIVD